jgi:hypothetical protein
VDADLEETVSTLKRIPGGPAMLAWFHGEPVFGDSEVVEIRLDRGGECSLTLWVTISVAGRLSGPPMKDALITMVLRDAIDLQIEGFSHQNVIGDLRIRNAPPKEPHPLHLGVGLIAPEHEITLEPVSGAFGTIRCTIAEIRMTPLTPP